MGPLPSTWWSALLLCLAVGCGPTYGLAEVPISGGTAEERAVIRETLLQFDQWTGGGRVELRSVTVEAAGAEVAGVYQRNKRITLRPGMALYYLAESVRHELCHALDHQEGFPSEDRGFEVLHDAFLQHGAASHEVGASDKRRAREGFALHCEQGPWTGALAAQDCDDLPRIDAAQASWMAAHVWSGVGVRPSLEREVVEGEPVVLDSLLAVLVTENGTLAAGKHDGEMVFFDGPDFAPPPEHPSGSSATPPAGTFVVDVVGQEGGHAVALAPVGPEDVEMLLGTGDGVRWGPMTDGCRRTDERFFTVGQGQLGSAWLDDDGVVRWSRLVEP